MNKLSFEEFYNNTIFSVYGCNKENLKRAWEFCQKQNDEEIKQLKEQIKKMKEYGEILESYDRDQCQMDCVCSECSWCCPPFTKIVHSAIKSET